MTAKNHSTIDSPNQQDTKLSKHLQTRLEALLVEYPHINADSVSVLWIPANSIPYQVYIAVAKDGQWTGQRRITRCLSNSKAHEKAELIRVYLNKHAGGAK